MDAIAQVVEGAVLSPRGDVRFNSLVRPRQPIPGAATALHHLDDAAGRRPILYRPVRPADGAAREALRRGVTTAYDCRILEQMCAQSNVPSLRLAGWHCAMLPAATFTGVETMATRGDRWHTLLRSRTRRADVTARRVLAMR